MSGSSHLQQRSRLQSGSIRAIHVVAANDLSAAPSKVGLTKQTLYIIKSVFENLQKKNFIIHDFFFSNISTSSACKSIIEAYRSIVCTMFQRLANRKLQATSGSSLAKLWPSRFLDSKKWKRSTGTKYCRPWKHCSEHEIEGKTKALCSPRNVLFSELTNIKNDLLSGNKNVIRGRFTQREALYQRRTYRLQPSSVG